MDVSLDELSDIRTRAQQDSAEAGTVEALEQVRVRYLGRNGVISHAFRRLGALPPADRPTAGAALNDLKAAVEQMLESRASQLRDSGRDARLAAEAIDVTLPGRGPAIGYTHILTRT